MENPAPDRGPGSTASVDPQREPLFSARDITVMALIAALVVVSKMLMRIPLRLPGHSGAAWIGVMVIGRGLVRKPGAGTMVGLTAGMLALAFTPGKEGIFLWVKYAAPGAMLDLLDPLVGDRLLTAPAAILTGALSNTTKLLAAYVLGILLGLPLGFLAAGLGAAAVSHAFFGGVGGLVASLVLRRLERARIPQLRAGNGGRR